MIKNNNVRIRIEKKRNQRKNQRIKFVKDIITSTLLLSIAFITVLNISFAIAKPDYKDATRVIVQSGDTVWSIAKEYKNNKEDIRALVEEIIYINKVNPSTLLPGTELIIPE